MTDEFIVESLGSQIYVGDDESAASDVFVGAIVDVLGNEEMSGSDIILYRNGSNVRSFRDSNRDRRLLERAILEDHDLATVRFGLLGLRDK